MPENRKIFELRELLAAKYPSAPSRANGWFELDLPHLEENCRRCPKGAITEACGSVANGALFIQALIETAHHRKTFVALIDAADSFAPDSCAWISHLLWIRCTDADQAMRSADLLIRDGNLPLIILDLQMNADAQLRRIPPGTWHRFQRLLEQTDMAFLAITPSPIVPCASTRFQMESTWEFESLKNRREKLRARLEISVTRKRAQTTEPQLQIA